MISRELERRLERLERGRPGAGPVVVVWVPPEIDTIEGWEAVCSKARERYSGEAATLAIFPEFCPIEDWPERSTRYLAAYDRRKSEDEQGETDTPET